LKLSGKHQFLVDVNVVNILRGSIHTIKKSSETLVATTKESGVGVNVEKTNYMFLSHERNVGIYHNMNLGNTLVGSMEKFKYLGTKLTNRNCIYEEAKIRLRSGDTFYHSVQNILTSSLVPKNIKIKVLRPVIMSASSSSLGGGGV
jgi:protein associated with RNAse G/E